MYSVQKELIMNLYRTGGYITVQTTWTAARIDNITKGGNCMAVAGAFIVPHPPLILPEIRKRGRTENPEDN